MPCQLGGDLEHALGVERHPGGAIGLLQLATARHRRRAIEDADVVKPEEPALEQVAVIRVLAIHPPGEVRNQPVEHAGQKLAVALAADLRLALIDPQRRPRGHRRVDIAEVPLVRRYLSVRMLIAGQEQELDLLFSEVDVDERDGTQWNARSHAANHGYSHLSGIEITS